MSLFKLSGFSLIEVLISLFLISLILFGLDAMQMASLKQAKITGFLQVAINQLNNMSERLSVSDVSQQIASWNEENSAVLPSGFGTVNGIFPNYELTIYWGESLHSCAMTKIGESGCIKEKIQLASR